MLVQRIEVRVVPRRPPADTHFPYLAQIDQFRQRLVNRRPADFRQQHRGALVNFVCCQVDVLPGKHLRHHASLRRHLPVALAEALKQPFHVLATRRHPDPRASMQTALCEPNSTIDTVLTRTYSEAKFTAYAVVPIFAAFVTRG